jgi:lipid A 3-O-deacylase
MQRSREWLLLVALALLAGPALAAPPMFTHGSFQAGLRLSGGIQNHLPPNHSFYSGLEFRSWAPYVSVFPRPPMGDGPLYGIPEVGLEIMLQRYERPEEHRLKMAHGARGVARYHFLAFGDFVPYLEATVGWAVTDLRVREIRSSFTFVLEAGVGISREITGGLVVSLGYRFHHLSNAGLERPNRGINADAVVVGLSLPMTPPFWRR